MKIVVSDCGSTVLNFEQSDCGSTVLNAVECDRQAK